MTLDNDHVKDRHDDGDRARDEPDGYEDDDDDDDGAC